MENEIIHVAIVEDNDEIRETLSLIISGTKGFHCKHTFIDAESAIKELPNLYVNVVLMDIDFPGISGLEAVKELKPSMPEVEFLMLTIHQDEESIFQSLCAGATGYLVKDSGPAEILKSIEEVHKGGSPMSMQIARKVAKSFFQEKKENPLSEREGEVIQLLSEGFNYKAIANELFISPETVKSHIKNIYSKLHVNNSASAIKKAIKKGLI
ncbi:MAG: response regulator transcription factor [Bacteroidota bacterium]